MAKQSQRARAAAETPEQRAERERGHLRMMLGTCGWSQDIKGMWRNPKFPGRAYTLEQAHAAQTDPEPVNPGPIPYEEPEDEV